MSVQRKNEDELGWVWTHAVKAIRSVSTDGFPQVGPVCGAVGGSSESGRIDECFQ